MRKLRTIGTTAKLVLLALWLLAVIGLAVIGIQQATQRAFDGEVVLTESLPVTAQDTVYLEMRFHPNYASRHYRSDLKINYDDNNRKIMIAHDVRLIVKPTQDSTGRVEIIKSADGRDLRDARTRAENIDYGTEFKNNRLILNSYLTSGLENHYRNQEVTVTVYLPIGSTLYADENTHYYHRNSDYYMDILESGDEGKFLLITSEGAECLDCPEEEEIMEEPWDNSTDEWEESDTISEPGTDWDQVEDTTNSAGANLNYSRDAGEIYMALSASTTRPELSRISQEFQKSNNILINFSESTFEDNGELKELALAVDTNDGYSGKIKVSGFLLKMTDYGFYRNYDGEGKKPFHIGAM